MIGRIDERTEGRTRELMNERTRKLMDERTNAQTDEQTVEQTVFRASRSSYFSLSLRLLISPQVAKAKADVFLRALDSDESFYGISPSREMC